MKLTLNNIEKEVLKATKKLGTSLEFVLSYDCGNAYVNVKGSLKAIKSIIFDETGEFSTIYTIQYKEDIYDENEEPTGELYDVDNELYMGDSLRTALNKLRFAA